MHLLYLDDSGSAPNPTEDFLVLGGVSVYEAQAYYFTQELDRLAQDIDPSNPNGIEFHASEIFARRDPPWNRMSKAEAIGAIKAVLNVIVKSYESARLFACVVHKPSFPLKDPMEIAFEDLCSRFDLFLSRIAAAGERQRGLIILDQSTHETSLQDMARDFRALGTRWGSIRHLADTPSSLIRRRPDSRKSPTMSPMRSSGVSSIPTPNTSISSFHVSTQLMVFCTVSRTSSPAPSPACVPHASRDGHRHVRLNETWTVGNLALSLTCAFRPVFIDA